MEKRFLFIKKNPEIITTIVGLIIFLALGFFYNNVEGMLIVFLGVVVLGIIIGIIPFLIKIVQLIYYLLFNFLVSRFKKKSQDEI
ncbi:hypothetical protein [uncultured Flavobacterium sp.]|uniref:hypothetical protein n=1 Tax=uncultured Flavobacterium sp. TaxID=165435 RepID=UPI003081EF21